MIYTFGRYEVDTQNYELRRDHQVCKLEPQGFVVLIYLIEHRDHLVTREELLRNLWPGQAVVEATLNVCVGAVRRALGDNGQTQQAIKTVYRRGYRFIAEVTERDGPMAPAETPMFLETQQPEDHTEPMLPQQSFPSQDVLGGDYVLVTVLCSALENLEALDGLGLRKAYGLKQKFFAMAQDEVKRNGGVLRFFGTNAVFMLFGMSSPCEQHARRAIQAALSFQQSLHDMGVSIRCGVHTGPIEANRITDEQWLLSDGKSEVTTLAVWLHYLAKAGELLTSQATIACVENVYHVEHGDVCIPRHSEPMTAYRICGLLA